MTEEEFAARVLSALVREGYVRWPVEGARVERDGFLAEDRISSGVGLARLRELVRQAAEPGDDVETFERECREALEAERAALPPVRPGEGRHDALAARLGHPVHPLGRCRLGLSGQELRRYAPEYQPSFTLRWTGVREPVLAGEPPSWWPEPGELGLPPDVTPFPVHPLTAARGIVEAPASHLRVRPTLSMRTLAVTPREHLKVPLPTSTLGSRNVRSIKPGTLVDGARVQALLTRVAAEEGLPVLLADEQTYGHAGDPYLGFLVRRMPVADAVPVAALLARTPEGPYVVEELAGDAGVAEFFSGYLRVLFAWNVVLFEKYGIALEAHQQNVAVTPRLELLLKDNDGAMLAEGDFEDPRMVGDVEARARVFVTITLHLCAGALAFGLAERGLMPLERALGLVRDRLDEAVADPFLRSRTLDADRLPTKAMLTAGTLVPKQRTGAADINKHYGPPGPNYLKELPCR
ncbi:IucA/IucC family protein [Actinocorallia libanotica]|uniref:Siderophore synthetase component n=1 Tax=Actinocorallia libanotica TaxID=46162 RepID=A0ABN1QVT1_9ACTN